MPDIYAVQATVCGMGLDKDVAVITDARFSGMVSLCMSDYTGGSQGRTFGLSPG